VVKQGIESLENPVHQNLIHDWVINFISKPS
jgi:hypothetical protein